MADESIYMQELKVRAIVTSIAADGTLLRKTSSTGGREYESATGISIASNGLVTITGNLHMYTSAILLDDDQDSYIIADGDDRVKFVTNSLERFYLTNSGIVMNSNFDLNGNDMPIDAAGTMYLHAPTDGECYIVFSGGNYSAFTTTSITKSGAANNQTLAINCYSETVDHAPRIVLAKIHNNTIDTFTNGTTLDNETLGYIEVRGVETDPPQQDPACRIVFEQDGDSTSDRVPGAIVFQNSNGTTANIERMRIAADGTISLPIDNQNIKLGGGLDMGIYYDGTNANIDTDLVAASDLTIDCGTDKTVVLEVPVWDDLNFDPERSSGPTATLPVEVTINNVFHREFDDGNDQLCGACEEVPHHAKLSETLYPHFHCFLKNGETAGTTGVTFTLYWELRQSGSTTSGNVPLTVTSTELTNNPNQFFKEDTTGFSGPTAAGGQLAMTIARTAGNAGDVIVTTYGVHYKIDTIGSRTRSAK